MEMHGASIRASSEGLDRGATFTVEVTIAAQAPKRDNCQEGSGQAAAAPAARLLLVEDHPDTSRVLARLLERVGYCVRTAHSIASALELAASEPFDILLSDLGLPDGSGHDLMRQIRERHNLKGIALSGYGMEEDIRRSREAGFSDHVVKPVEMSQLNFVIKSVLADGA
jgi:DNA-binding response OmpR family regulator